jgi:pyrimidine 5'-nucleotidase
MKHLGLTTDDAHMLHQKYYKEYGLAIEGLTRHHKIDPLVFNYEVDDALPLDKILKPDPKLRKLLESLDTTKVKPWLLTNAYISHGKKVIKLLGVGDLFEGITYCDYGQLPLVCKPSQEMYAKAEKEAGAPSTESCYFVGTLLHFLLCCSPLMVASGDIKQGCGVSPCADELTAQMTPTSIANMPKREAGPPFTWWNPELLSRVSRLRNTWSRVCTSYQPISQTSLSPKRLKLLRIHDSIRAMKLSLFIETLEHFIDS